MDKTNIEKYMGAWIDNGDGAYCHIEISQKMRQIALEFGVPKSKLPTLKNCSVKLAQGSAHRGSTQLVDFCEHHDELQRELEELLNEYCTTDTPPKATCWAWNNDAFGLWYTWFVNEELA
tara:strand:- start:312 stop:671 length:360 start_codon:yes stop_codon:yes gene_type:complete